MTMTLKHAISDENRFLKKVALYKHANNQQE